MKQYVALLGDCEPEVVKKVISHLEGLFLYLSVECRMTKFLSCRMKKKTFLSELFIHYNCLKLF